MTDEARKAKNEAHRNWCEKNAEHLKAYRREYYKKNRERIRAANKEWRMANRDKVAEQQKKYWERKAEEHDS